MSQIHWVNPLSGSFTNTADWAGGVVPGAQDDAVLNAAGTAFTVTSGVSETVTGIQLGANATLAITGGTFIATAGTDGGENAGSIAVGDGATLAIGGEFNNAGTVSLRSVSNPADLVVTSNTTLDGGGTVSLSGGTVTMEGGLDSQILGPPVGHASLVNINETISGSGNIASGASGVLKLVNRRGGIIESIGGELYIGSTSVSSSIINHGVIESTPGTVFRIQNMTLSGAHGKLVVDAGGGMGLADCSISQQSVTIGYGGVLGLNGNSEINLSGVIHNSGLFANFNYTAAGIVLTNSTTLKGGGTLDLGENSTLSATGVVLTNVDNTIVGRGLVSGAGFQLINETAGVVDAYYAVGTLVIGQGDATIVNAGLIETTGSGRLTLDGTISNSGTIAADAGTLIISGPLTGNGAVSIDGGTLDFTGAFSGSVAFKGKSGVLELADSQTYGGTVSGFSTTGHTRLYLVDIAHTGMSQATFSGTSTGGILTVTDGTHTAHIAMAGDYLGLTFVTYGVPGGKGVSVVTQTPTATVFPGPSVPAFAAIMAGHGADSSGPAYVGTFIGHADALILAAPRNAVA